MNIHLTLKNAGIATLFLLLLPVIHALAQPSTSYKPIVLHANYDHTKWGIEPSDLVYQFAAYTTSFDGSDDNNGDGQSDCWGIPEWVAYQVNRKTGPGIEAYNRPTWMTDDSLNAQGIAPNDATYAVSGTRDLKEVKTDYRYVRGHMCPKDAADRISMEAGYNTHTVLNAVPQLQWQNNGIWKELENDVTYWADTFATVWVVCGPVFFDKTPSVWIGQNNEVRAAVPDALYKIVIREANTETGLETLAFILPNVIPKEKDDLAEYITSIGRIEKLTWLTFLSNLDLTKQEKEKALHEDLTSAQRASLLNSWGTP
ncbi:MAG: DNA/RNA non-specific endonuclease [Cyclobacteriaceae bacterium]|nr:DNA/RNA non-specific endonuclease [Cyclobacteriaceae bacterium]